MSISQRKRLGFTIIELLVVIVVIAILATIVTISYSGVQDRANAAKAASLASQYADIFEVYRFEEGRYPGSPGVTVCLGPPDSFPASSPFADGECSKYVGESSSWGTSENSLSVDDDFNASVSSYGAVIPADLKTVSAFEEFSFPWDSGSETTSYRGLIYHKQPRAWSSSTDDTNAYITYFLKETQECPNGEGQVHYGFTECKLSLEGGTATPGYNPWGRGGGGEG